jgi:hypothetical protein
MCTSDADHQLPRRQPTRLGTRRPGSRHPSSSPSRTPHALPLSLIGSPFPFFIPPLLFSFRLDLHYLPLEKRGRPVGSVRRRSSGGRRQRTATGRRSPSHAWVRAEIERRRETERSCGECRGRRSGHDGSGWRRGGLLSGCWRGRIVGWAEWEQ